MAYYAGQLLALEEGFGGSFFFVVIFAPKNYLYEFFAPSRLFLCLVITLVTLKKKKRTKSTFFFLNILKDKKNVSWIYFSNNKIS